MLKYSGKTLINTRPIQIKNKRAMAKDIPTDVLDAALTLAKINIEAFITALRNKIHD